MSLLKITLLRLLNSVVFSIAAFTLINIVLNGKLKIWEMVFIDLTIAAFYFLERKVDHKFLNH